MADDIDVKSEGRKITNRQQTAMRQQADDEDWARTKRTQRGWTKKAAQDKEIVGIMTTDPNTPERKETIRRNDYLYRTTADDKKKIPQYHKGGRVRKTGLAVLKKGEQVLTQKQARLGNKKLGGAKKSANPRKVSAKKRG